MINRVIERAKQMTSSVMAAPYAKIKKMKGEHADKTREAVRLARETKHLSIGQLAAEPEFQKEVMMARGMAQEEKHEVAKRKKKTY